MSARHSTTHVGSDHQTSRPGAIKLGFAERLEELRLAAGKPSYSQLERRHRALRRSTVGDALTGRSTPSLDLTLAYVRTCRVIAEAARLPTEGPLFDVDAWRERWLELQRALLPYRRQGGPEPVDEAPTRRLWPVHGAAPAPAATPRPPVPDTRRLTAVLDDGHRLGLAAVWLTGAPGSGKTALAVRWACAAHERFTGVAFVDLGASGAHGGPTPIETALATAITELVGGVRPDGPTCREFLTRLYRDVTADRRVLVILDDASPDLELRRLLPTGPGSFAIVTSRLAPTTHDDAVSVLPIDS